MVDPVLNRTSLLGSVDPPEQRAEQAVASSQTFDFVEEDSGQIRLYEFEIGSKYSSFPNSLLK